MVECLLCKQKVTGSNPFISIYLLTPILIYLFLDASMYNKPSNFFTIKKKDRIKRKCFSKTENSFFVLSVLSDTQAIQLSQKLRNRKLSSSVSIRNRCLLTGRAKSVTSKFKLSRLTFRDLALFGLIPGVQKASW